MTKKRNRLAEARTNQAQVNKTMRALSANINAIRRQKQKVQEIRAFTAEEAEAYDLAVEPAAKALHDAYKAHCPPDRMHALLVVAVAVEEKQAHVVGYGMGHPAALEFALDTMANQQPGVVMHLLQWAMNRLASATEDTQNVHTQPPPTHDSPQGE